MAWQAYLHELLPEGTGQLRVIVLYYDDADPANTGVGLAGPGNGTAVASTDLISITGHGLVAGDQVVFTAKTGGNGLNLNTTYFVIPTGLTTNAFSVALSPNGTVVDITTNATAITAFRRRPPAVIMQTATFPLPAGQPLTYLTAEIDRAGQQARALDQQRTSILASFPIGTTRAVP